MLAALASATDGIELASLEALFTSSSQRGVIDLDTVVSSSKWSPKNLHSAKPDQPVNWSVGRMQGARFPDGSFFPASPSRTNGPNIRVLDLKILRDGDGSLVETIPAGQMIAIQVTYETVNVPELAVYDIAFVADGIVLELSNVRNHTGTDTYVASMEGWYADAELTQLAVLVDFNNEVAESNEGDNFNSQDFIPSDPNATLAPLVYPIENQRDFPLVHTRYADIDPRAGESTDFAGGGFVIDGEHGWEIATADFSFQDQGIPVRAAAAGTVTEVSDGAYDREEVGAGTGRGNYVIIDHGNGWETRYQHVARDSIVVGVGQEVAAGQWIADLGSSGRSFAPNLHFEVRRLGMPVEPMMMPESYFIDPETVLYQPERPAEIMTIAIQREGYIGNNQEGVPDEEIFDAGDNILAGTRLILPVRLNYASAGDVVTARFVSPDGIVRETSSQTINQTRTRPRLSFYLPAAKWRASLGHWRADILLNDESLGSHSFEVTNIDTPPRLMVYSQGISVANDRTTPLGTETDSVNICCNSIILQLRNFGTQTLELGTPELPMGWSLVSTSTTVPAHLLRFIEIRVGNRFDSKNFGQVRIPSNDPQNPFYSFQVEKKDTTPGGNVEIELPGPDVAYRLGDGPKVLDATAEFRSLFTKIGKLHVAWEGGWRGGDTLEVLSTGDGAGQVRVDGTSVFYEGTQVGSISSEGNAPTSMVIDFQSNVSHTAASAVIQAIAFSTTSTDLLPRFLRLYAFDTSGLPSTHAYKSVRVQPPVETPPTVTGIEFPEVDLSRSRMDSMQVTIDGSVVVLPDAIELKHRDSGSLVDVDMTTIQENSQTLIQLGFSGAQTEAGSLVDGNYQMTLRGDRLLGPSGPLDGDGDGVPGGNYVFGDEEADAFFRLFGDTDGNRVVNFSDFVSFRNAFGSSNGDGNYRSDLDFDQSDSLGFTDFLQFRSRFANELPFN